MTKLASTTLILFLATLMVATECRARLLLENNATGRDCTLVGAWDGASKTCTLTQDVFEQIEIVSHGITLDGNGHRVIDPTPFTLRCVEINANNITVQNLSISGCLVAVDSKGDNNVIRNVVATDNIRGLQVRGGGPFNFNLMENNVVTGSLSAGIALFDGGSHTVINNSISSSASGISIIESGANVVLNNNIDENRFEGLQISNSFDNVVGENTISGNVIGLRLLGTGSNNNRIINNNFVSNTVQIQLLTIGWTGISTDPTGTTFTINRRFWDLNEIDPTTGQTIARIGSTEQSFVSDIDFRGNTLYADFWDGQGSLGLIDTATGHITPVGPFGPDPFDELGRPLQNGGIGVHPNGTIYAVESNFLSVGPGATAFFKVDPLTGAAFDLVRVQLSGTDPDFGLDALEITPSGRFLVTRGGGSNEFYEINPATGELTLIPLIFDGNITASLNGLESSPTAGHLIGTTNIGELVDVDLGAGTAILIGRNFGPAGNVFSDPAPTGGNFWDTFDDPAEGCIDQAPIDGFCDAPFVFTGGQDDLPWTQPIGSILNVFFDALVGEIADLGVAGALNAGQGNALTKKLTRAMKSLAKGNDGAAVNQVEAFIDHVEDFITTGTLTGAQGQSLIDQALVIIDLV